MNNTHPPRLIIISAPSGGGKTTLCQKVLDYFDQLTLSISTTTRAPRGNEVHGREYFFVDKNHFEEQKRQNRFAEWALVHNHYYGTSKDTIENAFSQGKSVLLDIDVQGAKSLKEAFPHQCLSIFLSPPNLDELERRLRSRDTDEESVIQQRLTNAKAELEEAKHYDHIIINDDINQALTELKQLIGNAIGFPS